MLVQLRRFFNLANYKKISLNIFLFLLIISSVNSAIDLAENIPFNEVDPVWYSEKGNYALLDGANQPFTNNVSVLGDLGIGITNPGEKLEVSGNIQLTTDNDKLIQGTGEDYSQYFDGNNQNFDLTGGSFKFNGGPLRLKADNQLFTQGDDNDYSQSFDGTYQRYVTTGTGYTFTGGNVGMGGVTAPLESLHLIGNIRCNAGGGYQMQDISADATQPTYSFNGDLDTGMFRITTNTLGFSTSGAERVRIDGNGQVGIGRNPSGKLSVEGEVKIGDDNDGVWIRRSGTKAEIIAVNQLGSGWNDLDIRTTSGTQLYLKTDGNVGIGTDSPDTKLEVSGNLADIKVTDSTNGGTGVLGTTGTAGNSGSYIQLRDETGTVISQISGRVPGSLLTYFNGGNFGIGTTTPSEKLEVDGNIKQTADNNKLIQGAGNDYSQYFDGTNQQFELTSGNYIFSSNTAGKGLQAGYTFIGNWLTAGSYAMFTNKNVASEANSYAMIQSTAGETFINTASGKKLYFRINNTDKMVMDSNGNVGIGTTTPSEKLEVDGNAVIRGDLNVTGNINVGGCINYNGGTLGVCT